MTYTIIKPNDPFTLPPLGSTAWLFERDYGWILGMPYIDDGHLLWGRAYDYPQRTPVGAVLEAEDVAADDLDVLAWAPFVVPEVPEEYRR